MDANRPPSDPAAITEEASTVATYALIGWPLGFSLSPAMHSAAFAALGVAARYVLLPTAPDDLPGAIAALREGGLAGANITAPHKVHVRRLLDDESDLVTDLGAVNTILRSASGLRGENTDPAGFRQALQAVDLSEGRGKRAIVLGAGGAARAVVHALLGAGFAVAILSRGSAQSGVLAAQLYRAFPGAQLATSLLTAETVIAHASRADLLVNATPVGAAPATRDRLESNGSAEIAAAPGHPMAGPEPVAPPPGRASPSSLWPPDLPIPGHLTVIDLVAWPLETALVTHARASGARAIGGFEMLLGQAAHVFTLWTGHPAPVDVMRSAGLAAAAGNSPSPKTI